MYACDNCGKRFDRTCDLQHVFPDIPGLTTRIEPGGTVPDGECPWCGALVYECRNGEPCLLEALEHACARLNEIPHRYDDTDFGLLRKAVQEARKPVRALVLLEGGLVTDVLADRPGIEVAVLDQDIEGMFDEDIAIVSGRTDTLRGVLTVHESTPAPALIDSAWRT